MANLLPDKITDRLEWFENRIDTWTTNATAIGLSTAQTTALAALIDVARDAYVAAEAIRIASKDATLAQANAMENLTTIGTGLVSIIRGKAESTLDPSIYTKASIPPRAAPTPSGNPAQPTDVSGLLDEEGFLNLTWKGSVAHSTFYTIWRKLDGETEFSMIGTVGAKKWLDETVPAGTPSAIYYVKPHRGAKTGTASGQLNVIFGISPSVVSLKIAA